jgi:hypothetical protein
VKSQKHHRSIPWLPNAIESQFVVYWSLWENNVALLRRFSIASFWLIATIARTIANIDLFRPQTWEDGSIFTNPSASGRRSATTCNPAANGRRRVLFAFSL